jgi:hypothetical protein
MLGHMKTAPHTIIVTLAFGGLLLTCSCKPQISSDEFEAHENRVFSTNCTNDIRVAEKSLLDGLQDFSRYKSSKIEGVDFDAREALYHEGLFLIYRKMHETNKMDIEFRESFDCMARSRRRWRQSPPPSMTYDEFANQLDLRDCETNVRWKTNQVVP